MADVTSPFGFPYPEDTDLVRDGASDIENLAEGVNDYLTGGYLYAGTRYYTSSGTFDKADPLLTGDIGLRAIRVRMVGGGGSGGSSSSAAANLSRLSRGGGGGVYAESFITDISSLDASVTVTRGAGGTSPAAGNNAGVAGGASSFGTDVTADGGNGGVAASFSSVDGAAEGTAGKSSGTGNIIISGGGTIGIASSSSGINARTDLGGHSHLGAGAHCAAITAASTFVNGNPGLQYGGGGGGCASTNSGGAAQGGAGANGIVIVDCFV